MVHFYRSGFIAIYRFTAFKTTLKPREGCIYEVRAAKTAFLVILPLESAKAGVKPVTGRCREIAG